MSPAPLTLRGLNKVYGKGTRAVQAVCDLEFTVNPGEVFAFLGPNGAGKTTTMHLALDYIRATSGTIDIFGVSSRLAEARARLGFLPEIFSFDRFLSGRETLRYYGRLSGVPAGELDTRAERWLDRLGLTEAADRRLQTYSKGMLQRIGLAQALVGEPDLLMLDEPTSGMDPAGKREVMDLFRQLRTDGRTIFLSSHILADVEAVADRVAVIHKGRLRYCGALGDMLRGENLTQVRFAAPGADVQAKLPDAQFQDGLWQLEVQGDSGRRDLLTLIQQEGWELHSAVPRRKALDDAFLDLLGTGSEHDAE